MVRVVIEIADTIIFLWLAVKGLLLLFVVVHPMPIFAGCALVCTAIFWKSLDKTRLVDAFEKIVRAFNNR